MTFQRSPPLGAADRLESAEPPRSWNRQPRAASARPPLPFPSMMLFAPRERRERDADAKRTQPPNARRTAATAGLGCPS